MNETEVAKYDLYNAIYVETLRAYHEELVVSKPPSTDEHFEPDVNGSYIKNAAGVYVFASAFSSDTKRYKIKSNYYAKQIADLAMDYFKEAAIDVCE